MACVLAIGFFGHAFSAMAENGDTLSGEPFGLSGTVGTSEPLQDMASGERLVHRHPPSFVWRDARLPEDLAVELAAPSIVPAERSAPVVRSSRPDVAPDSDAPPEVTVIVMVGDTGINAHQARVRPNRGYRHGKGYAWRTTTDRIAPLIDGHLNFANIETVVTARNSIAPLAKSFNFRMHPNGARHLVDIGFNVFSLANNHSADYGRRGILDTLKHSDALLRRGLRAHAGLGRDRAGAVQAKTFAIGRSRFGFAAMGIGARAPGVSRAGIGKPGQVNIYGVRDFGDVVDGLATSDVDYRILSMHYGAEREVQPSAGQIAQWRDDIVRDRNIDLVIGHHAHVAQGVQLVDGKLIFYGLGNFLHLGTADMGKLEACRDYGLLARVFVVREATGKMTAQAVQVVPLRHMHLRPRPRTGKGGRRRVQFLNALAHRLDDDASGARGVRFAPQKDGSGLYCAAGAENLPGRVGRLCQGYRQPDVMNRVQRRRLLSSCRSGSGKTVVSSGKGASGKRQKRRGKTWGLSSFLKQQSQR